MAMPTPESTLANLQNQINEINKVIRALKTEMSDKDRIIAALSKELHRLQNDFGSQRKKLKSEVSKLEGKISSIRR